MIVNILVILSASLFCLYTLLSIWKFNVPDSLSKTHYLWRGLGIKFPWFSITLSIIGLLMTPAILEASSEHNLQFLAFFTTSTILFVAIAPNYLDPSETFVHYGAAGISALSSILTVCLIFSSIDVFFVSLAGIVVVTIATRTWNCWLFWFELTCFMSIFLTILS